MFLDYMKRYTDGPFLVEIGEVGEGAHEGIDPATLVPGKFLTAAKMPEGTTERTENNEFRPLVIEADGTVKDPGGTLADRFGEEGAGGEERAEEDEEPDAELLTHSVARDQ